MDCVFKSRDLEGRQRSGKALPTFLASSFDCEKEVIFEARVAWGTERGTDRVGRSKHRIVRRLSKL